MTMAFQKGDHHNLGFNFSSHKRNVDWRRINVLNIDLLVRTVDIDALQEYINDVTYCSLEIVRCPQCMSPADPTLVKLFRLAQLSLEWLHHCQEKLISGLQNTEDKLKSSEEECQKLKEKMKGVVSELKSRRTIIKKQQSLFAANINNGIQCGHCEKKYLNAFFLQKHMLRRHPDQCQNLMVKIDQKNSEIESLKLEINSLRMQLAQAAKEQQEKLELHYEKEKLKLEKSAMQVEAENLRLKAENLRLQQENLEEQTNSGRLQQELQNEKEERQQEVMMFQAEILRLQQELQNGKEERQQEIMMFQSVILTLEEEKVEFQNGKEELQQQTTVLQAEILRLQQEKVEFQNGKQELQQQTTMLQAEILKLQQEKVEFQNGKEALQQETTMLQAEILRLQQENHTLESENSTLKDVNKKQDHRVQKKNRREQNKSRKQTGKVSMPTPTQSSTMLVNDSSSDETSSEQEETKILKSQFQKQECDTFQRPSEDKRKLSRRPQLPRQSERNELQTDKKLTGNKKEKPEMPARSQFRLPCKVIQVKPVAPVSELLDQPAEPDKTPRAKPKCPSYSIISSDEESETGGDTSQQQEVMRIWSIRPWLPSDSGGSEQETDNQLDVNKKGEPGKVSSAGRSAKAQPEAMTSTEAPKKFSFQNIFKNLKKKWKGKTEKKEQNEVKSEKPVEGRQSQLQTNKKKTQSSFKKPFGIKSPPKVSDVNSVETIVESQKPKTQQKRMKSHQNISIKRSATSSQPAASQLEQKTTVNKYPWFRPKK